MLTNVYIDGTNLYYGALRGTPHKWLDPRRMIELVFPHDEIQVIHYFTSAVRSVPTDPAAPIRQQAYIRALRSMPGVVVHLGIIRGRGSLREKMTDVALATRLVADASQHRFEKGIVVSNDADFVPAIICVRSEFGADVAVLNPAIRRRTQGDLETAATYVRKLRPIHVASSPLPSPLRDEIGLITKPVDW
ncbi:MAG: NYN domain-containing protein [Chloroflexi bacterium]|nr:NYN domain-containing protein [Chloroflexota bacterium]